MKAVADHAESMSLPEEDDGDVASKADNDSKDGGASRASKGGGKGGSNYSRASGASRASGGGQSLGHVHPCFEDGRTLLDVQRQALRALAATKIASVIRRFLALIEYERKLARVHEKQAAASGGGTRGGRSVSRSPERRSKA